MKKLVILGAGGHAKGIVDIIQLGNHYELIALLDPNSALHGTHVLGVPILGGDEQLSSLKGDGVTHVFIGLGSVGNAKPRQVLYEKALSLGFELATIIHPSAIIAASASIGRGTVLMAGSIVNADSCVDDNVIINTGAIIEHDNRIGAHAHVATGARLAGAVTVGQGAHIGAGATVKQNITIGSRAIVGAGAVVVKDVPTDVTVVGVPAIPLIP